MVDQNVVSYVTVIDVPNPELQLKPGMTANVAITIARADDVLKVPNAALRYRPDAATLGAHGQAATPQPAGQRSRAPSAPRVNADGRVTTRPVRRVWVLDGESLTAVRVEKTGADVSAHHGDVGGDMPEGARVVTGAAQAATATAQPSGARPLDAATAAPRRPRRCAMTPVIAGDGDEDLHGGRARGARPARGTL